MMKPATSSAPRRPCRRLRVAAATESLRHGGWRLAALGLLLFHLVLLWRRLVDLSLLEPPVAARWAAAIMLALVARRLRLHAGPDWGSRRVLAFLLAVLLLHLLAAGSVGAAPEGPGSSAPQSGMVLLVPLVLTLALDLGRSLAAAAGRWLRRSVDGRPRPVGVLGPAGRGKLEAGLRLCFQVRPPPA